MVNYPLALAFDGVFWSLRGDVKRFKRSGPNPVLPGFSFWILNTVPVIMLCIQCFDIFRVFEYALHKNADFLSSGCLPSQYHGFTFSKSPQLTIKGKLHKEIHKSLFSWQQMNPCMMIWSHLSTEFMIMMSWWWWSSTGDADPGAIN